MEITVTGRHPSINASMRSYAEDKIRKVSRIFDRLVSARVTLEVEGVDHRAEASIHGPRGAVLIAHATAPDMTGALDQLESRLERQLRKLKTKIEGHRLLRT